MALISSESITLMVKGTLESEFLTMFWPTRLTYSTITGSVTMWADFSTSMEYCLPVRISQSVEYQLARPRPPMLRVPTALTSSSLPALMLVLRSSPGDGRRSVLFAALTAAAASLLSLGVAVGWPGMGFSAGTSGGMVGGGGVGGGGLGGVGGGVCAGGGVLAGVWVGVGLWDHAATERVRKAVRPRCVTDRMWGLLVGRFPAE